ncbi:MAG: hypothetical protein ACK4ND_10300 [Cytophagaceae bacterium]
MKKEALKKGEELLPYIPQRPPFVMVDKIYEKGNNFLVSGLTIEPGNIMVEEGKFKEGGLVENMAQTAGLFAGTKFIDNNLPVPVGYIAGIKNLVVDKLPLSGEEIFTKTTLTNELLNIQVVVAEVFNEQQEKIAHCELRIFIKSED